jgi:hypothetical protein
MGLMGYPMNAMDALVCYVDYADVPRPGSPGF